MSQIGSFAPSDVPVAWVYDLNKADVGEKAGQTSSMRDGITCLWSMECLFQAVRTRFQYHFYGSKKTNQLNKPEWYFNHMRELYEYVKPSVFIMASSVA